MGVFVFTGSPFCFPFGFFFLLFNFYLTCGMVILRMRPKFLFWFSVKFFLLFSKFYKNQKTIRESLLRLSKYIHPPKQYSVWCRAHICVCIYVFLSVRLYLCVYLCMYVSMERGTHAKNSQFSKRTHNIKASEMFDGLVHDYTNIYSH